MVKKVYAQKDMRKYMQIHTHNHILTIIAKQILMTKSKKNAKEVEWELSKTLNVELIILVVEWATAHFENSYKQWHTQ